MNRGRRHPDPGLQPERTWLAWGRTMLAMVVVSLLFLRWIPGYGGFPAILIGVAMISAGGVSFRQRRRYLRIDEGVEMERVHADAVAVLAVGASIIVLALLSAYVILALPLQ
ncbi:uncharacterized membrane protein YidH (DUF202 family) [Arthrobacter sp. CAN_A214]|uniref:DUF202 domain-containing protein n=1 Tax=Arthrobacter sp. CAN_A214 TaxID=2787720 RepID=UPI0018C96145